MGIQKGIVENFIQLQVIPILLLGRSLKDWEGYLILHTANLILKQAVVVIVDETGAVLMDVRELV